MEGYTKLEETNTPVDNQRHHHSNSSPNFMGKPKGTYTPITDGRSTSLAVTLYNISIRVLYQLPAGLMGAAFAFLDNVPYGLLVFPGGGTKLRKIGITMVLESTIAAQIFMTCNSAFPFAMGACIVENIPFMHSISKSIFLQLQQKGDPLSDPVSTIMATTTIATFATACAFWALGHLKIGFISEFMPKHVLLGCISGMGFFIIFAAVGMAAGHEWAWDFATMQSQLESDCVVRWALTISLEVFLLTVGPRVDSIFFVPSFLLSTPFIFYGVIYYAGIPLQEARAARWVFDLQTTKPLDSVPWWKDVIQNLNVWHSFSLRGVDWEVVVSQFMTILAVVFFSVLHTPLNVPALIMQSGVEADLNHEFKVHAQSNFFSSLFGGLQSYMTYSTSALLQVSGLSDRIMALPISAISCAVICIGPQNVLGFIPVCSAALFLMHVGMVLVKDGIIESLSSLDRTEYFVVWVIAIAMQWDFMQGLAIGAVVSVFTFLVNMSRIEVATMIDSGIAFRSNRLRSPGDSEYLDTVMADNVRVMTLKGTVFFGNAYQVLEKFKILLTNGAIGRFFLFDFSSVVDMDCTAVDKFSTIANLANQNGATLVFAGMGNMVMDRASCWLNVEFAGSRNGSQRISDEDNNYTTPGENNDALSYDANQEENSVEESVRFFATVSAAVLWCEEELLKERQITRSESDAIHHFLHSQSLEMIVDEGMIETPKKLKKLSLVSIGDSPVLSVQLSPPQITPNLEELAKYLSAYSDAHYSRFSEVLRLAALFVPEVYRENHYLWRKGDSADFLCIVRCGVLGLESHEASSVNASENQHTGVSIKQLAVSDDTLFSTTCTAKSRLPSSDAVHKPIKKSSAVFTSSPMSPMSATADVFGRREKLTKFNTLSPMSVKHPVWNKRIFIHHAACSEYIVTGELIGDLSMCAGKRRGGAVKAVTTSSVWTLQKTAMLAMEKSDSRALYILQKIVLRSAYQRMHGTTLLRGGGFA